MAVAHPFRSFLSHFWQQASGRYLTVLIADVAAIVCAIYILPLLSTQVPSDFAAAHATYGIVWFTIGLVVFILRPFDLSSALFNLIGVGLLLQELELGIHAPAVPPAIGAIVLVYLLLNSAVVIHFLTVFPKSRAWRWWVSGPFYILFGILWIASELKFLGTHSDIVLRLAESGKYLYPVMNVVALVLVLYSYFSSKDAQERKRLRWTLTGGAVALVWQAWTINLPRLFGMTVEMNPWLLEAGLFAAPIGIAVGLVWYNAFDIDLVLSRTLAYAVVLGMVVVAYETITELIVLVVGQGVAGSSSLVISIVATLAIAAGFDPVRDKTQQLIDGWFFRLTKDERLAPDTPIRAVQELVEKHGGSLELISEQEGTAEFSLKIPRGK